MTPIMPVTTVIPVMTPAKIQIKFRLGPPAAKRPESKISRINRGLTTPRPAVIKISRPTITTCLR